MVNRQSNGTRKLVQIPFKGDVRPDFVIFGWFSSIDNLDECKIFIVPAKIVDHDVLESHNHWHRYSKRDGQPRTDSGHLSIDWSGRDTETNIFRGFAVKWEEYAEAWHLLEHFVAERIA
jgi:hypothetical protein